MPSGNAVAAYDLLLLSRMTARTEYEELLLKQLDFLAESAAGYPAGHAFSLLTMLMAESPSRSLICALPEDEAQPPVFGEMCIRDRPFHCSPPFRRRVLYPALWLFLQGGDPGDHRRGLAGYPTEQPDPAGWHQVPRPHLRRRSLVSR